ncbi:MAG: hypothetical protein ACXWJB_05890 [Limisphaerales bacterium]
MRLTNKHPDASAFTFVDLLAVCAGIFLCVLIVLPALGRTHNQNSLTQSINNLRQLTSAWLMYPAQNGGRIVYSYPKYSSNTNTWCQGDAEAGGIAAGYSWGGADPRGIQAGDLWPYVHTIAQYKCPSDNRLAYNGAAPYKNQPILRSYSINSFMAGQTYGTGSDTTVLTPSTWDSGPCRFFVKDNQISKPAHLFVFIEEDGASINDGMFFMSMGSGGTQKLYDLPTRHHFDCYPLTFADGHAETYRLQEVASLTWTPGAAGGINDWKALTNVTTVAF